MELKLCPFCGGEPFLDEDYMFQVICTECRACVKLEKYKSDAIAMWNCRVIDDVVKVLLRQLGA